MGVSDPAQLIADFRQGLIMEGIGLPHPPIGHQVFPAGNLHANCRRGPPPGQDIVYVFSLSAAYAASSGCAAGPNRVLRVGQATTTGRMTQNYIAYPTAPGLATKLSVYKVFWLFLGLPSFNPAMAELWIQMNLDRDQFELPVGNKVIRDLLERCVRGRLGALYEG